MLDSRVKKRPVKAQENRKQHQQHRLRYTRLYAFFSIKARNSVEKLPSVSFLAKIVFVLGSVQVKCRVVEKNIGDFGNLTVSTSEMFKQ